MFLPILALIAWTLLIVIWMAVVRMPEMMRASRAGNAPGNCATKIEAEQHFSPPDTLERGITPTIFLSSRRFLCARLDHHAVGSC